MHVLLLIVLHAALCCATSDNHQISFETPMDNVLVLTVPRSVGDWGEVPLTCGEAYQNQPVFWKKNGEDLIPALQGNKVKILVRDLNGGNYSCHQTDGQFLNHTVIMMQLDKDNTPVILKEKSPEDGYIHCSAPNYKGSFHCTWTRTQHRSNAAVLLVKAERNLEKIPCELSADGSGVHCQDTNCPYKEEQHRILLKVYIHSYSRLEMYPKAFYLREIVTPAKLPNLSLSVGKHFTWSYPNSWDKPDSYFSLHFQVKMVRHEHSCDSKEYIMHNTTEQTKYEINVRTKKYVFCVRAKDKHTGGPWSHWSHCM
ncbi:interleukin-12 subunit beta [Scomber japonicus]|uniref:interleukin-12 subunit beta n=1 Tax=Scomber japonicus TaxID=13676 RepID=UPI0023060DBB|nr:interleukin-12 subunit beta [Scomber japonicus]